MLTLTRKTLLAGFICVLLGAFVAWHGAGYSIGTLGEVGAGLFPAALGGLLLLIGLALLGQAFLAMGEDTGISLNLRPYIAIPGALAAFALTIDRFGMLPAVALTTVIASLADPNSSKIGTLLLALGLMALTYVLFVLVLQIPLAAVRWGA
ncbi:tripartite tricarboxylate transporter TctB family protein [Rhodoligotrophos defluvii]|uniref:tripartite tricarboxylate transporter TctB family protein n=1 Tax=Rhodoligotrophos defluvii TaxID=2561934 RepID=UPI0010C936F3|nr:tripartite tricarboxylate transporter TctB family protein [Rhodoligotrophos defluvii]